MADDSASQADGQYADVRRQKSFCVGSEEFAQKIALPQSHVVEIIGRMSEPSVTEALIRLENLVEKDLHSRINARDRACIIGWGLFFTAVHQIRAVLELHRVDACAAAAPNRRTAFEHAVTLIWCVDQGDRIADIYNRKLRGDQIQLAKALRAEGSNRFPENAYQRMVENVRKIEEEIPPDPNERLAKIEHLLDGYGLAAEKTRYQLESRYVHATPTSIQMFFRDNGEEIEVSQNPLHVEIVQCKPYCLAVLHVSMLAFNELLLGKPWSAELQNVGAEFGLPSTLPTWRNR